MRGPTAHKISRRARCARNGSLDSVEHLASVIECYEQWRAVRAVEYPHATLEVSEVTSGGKVSLIRIAALEPRAKLLKDAVGF